MAVESPHSLKGRADSIPELSPIPPFLVGSEYMGSGRNSDINIVDDDGNQSRVLKQKAVLHKPDILVNEFELPVDKVSSPEAIPDSPPKVSLGIDNSLQGNVNSEPGEVD